MIMIAKKKDDGKKKHHLDVTIFNEFEKSINYYFII